MNSGKIIPIAYPDTYVKYSTEQIQHKLFPFIGLGKKGYIKAGHALLLLINNDTGYIHYFDFGRYVTPHKKGRVRSEKTDTELHIPLKAEISTSAELKNLDEILLWLEAHPEKTHGQGRMIASVCDEIDYDKALRYLEDLQNQGSVPYLTFSSTIGSNCSRLVTDTLIKSCNNPTVVKKMKRNNCFTPSPLGNVKHAATDTKIYKIYLGKIEHYNQSILKENLTNYFDRNIPDNKIKSIPLRIGNAQLLKSIGASAYFEIKKTSENSVFVITRYTECFKIDFEGLFRLENEGFKIDNEYNFVFDCNCSYCHIEQHNIIYRLNVI